MADCSATWAVVVHGGAKDIAPALRQRNRDGCRAAAAAAAAVLDFGGTALAAAEIAVRTLENDSVFNAGYGSVPNADGDVEMDAALMDGATLDLGAVAAVRRLRNPISAAARLLREPPILLVADGAERFAGGAGLELVDPSALIVPAPLASEGTVSHDTVGCVARDSAGNVAAATSTGGLAGTRPGRVGDSPLPGCGLYADNRHGGVSLSGDGEAIARTITAARILTALESGRSASEAARAISVVEPLNAEAGAIVIDREGRIGMAHNSAHFAVGIATATTPPSAYLHRDEIKDAFHD